MFKDGSQSKMCIYLYWVCQKQVVELWSAIAPLVFNVYYFCKMLRKIEQIRVK